MKLRHTSFSLLLVFFLTNQITLLAAKNNWTALHKKVFTTAELRENKNKKQFVFSKAGLMPFTQLVFSWNAFRPKKGHFTFFVQVRNARTKEWQPWHKMVEWGKNVQKSHVSKRKVGTSYVHVRLETKRHQRADAFRIKVKTERGASASDVRSLAASISDFSQFRSETGSNKFKNLSFVRIKGVPRLSQMVLNHEKAKVMCSPTSCSMLTGYLLRKKIDPVSFAQHCFDTGLEAYGSWPFNTAHAFELCGGKAFFYTTRLNSFTDLHKWLSLGIPVAVSVRGGLPGAPKEYNKGHLFLVVGWDPKGGHVLVHDPACSSNRTTFKKYRLHDFLIAWEKSHRLTYLAYPLRSLSRGHQVVAA